MNGLDIIRMDMGFFVVWPCLLFSVLSWYDRTRYQVGLCLKFYTFFVNLVHRRRLRGEGAAWADLGILGKGQDGGSYCDVGVFTVIVRMGF